MSDCRLRKRVLERMTRTLIWTIVVSQCHKWFYDNNCSCHQFTFTHKNTQQQWYRLKHWLKLKHIPEDLPCLDTLFIFLIYFFYFLSHTYSRPNNGLKGTSALAGMYKGTRVDTFSALQVRLTGSVIISVEHWLLQWTFTQESRPSYVMASLAL